MVNIVLHLLSYICTVFEGNFLHVHMMIFADPVTFIIIRMFLFTILDKMAKL